MIINEVYKRNEGQYLKADQLGDKRPEVVIAGVVEEVFTISDGPKKGEEETKGILSFEGKDSLLVLNVTNATTIAELYGQNTDNWIGRTITIFGASTMFGGNMVPCIRVCQPRGYHIDMRAKGEEAHAKMSPPGHVLFDPKTYGKERPEAPTEAAPTEAATKASTPPAQPAFDDDVPF